MLDFADYAFIGVQWGNQQWQAHSIQILVSALGSCGKLISIIASLSS